MNELKCKECGTVLEQGVKECPSCGCPVEIAKSEYVNQKKPKTIKINIMSIISMLIGVAIIIMGVSVMNKKANINTYTAINYDVDSVTFGGDFYTEIYGASDVIVDELSDINSGIDILSDSACEVSNVIYSSFGMLIVVIGFSVIAISCNYIIKNN